MCDTSTVSIERDIDLAAFYFHVCVCATMAEPRVQIESLHFSVGILTISGGRIYTALLYSSSVYLLYSAF